jgi:hypothetical protein
VREDENRQFCVIICRSDSLRRKCASLVKYSQMVSAIFLGHNTTATTYNIARIHCTCRFDAEESNGCENGDTIAISPSLPVGDTVGDAISMIATKISELDTIGFDKTMNLDENEITPYKIDA